VTIQWATLPCMPAVQPEGTYHPHLTAMSYMAHLAQFHSTSNPDAGSVSDDTSVRHVPGPVQQQQQRFNGGHQQELQQWAVGRETAGLEDSSTTAGIKTDQPDDGPTKDTVGEGAACLLADGTPGSNNQTASHKMGSAGSSVGSNIDAGGDDGATVTHPATAIMMQLPGSRTYR
jgi:hypothetical protein